MVWLINGAPDNLTADTTVSASARAIQYTRYENKKYYTECST
jgi:hypothetical protein